MRINRFILSLVFLTMSLGSMSCERLKKKMEIRERRIQYLKSTIDSSRKNSLPKLDSIAGNIKK